MTRNAGIWIVLMSAFLLANHASAGGFLDERPWLLDRSSWAETADANGNLRGWWAVGNSRVFGIVGPDIANAGIHQITGPHIMLAGVMNNGSAFGPSRLNLIVGGRPVAFTKETLSRVRGTDIVVMDLSAPGVEMTVFSYAPFDVNALLRTVVIRNTGDTPLNDVVLQGTVSRTIVKDGRLFNSFKGATDGNAMGQTRQFFSTFLEPSDATGPTDNPGEGTLTTKIGSLAPGAEAVRTQALVFSMEEVADEAATFDLIRKEGVALLTKTRDDWRAWLDTTTRLECPDQRLVDLLDDTKMVVKIQTAEPQTAAGPMEFFAGVWVRDSNGPFVSYLRMGRLDAARAMLEFYYRASAYNKRIANWEPMDIDVTRPVDPALDWSTVPNDPVEIPCWIILQHKRYYDYTGDIELIRAHWDYLKRCLYGQLVDEKGEPFHTVNYGSKEPGPNALYRFPHHGDETWIYPGFEVLNSAVFPEPNDHPHWDSYSADSTWEFVVSAEALADFAARLRNDDEAKALDKIAADSRAACERDYWMPERGLYAPALNMRSLDVHQPPFDMVNFDPLWIGYLQPNDPKAVSNVVETMKYTLNPNYVTDATETLRVYVGMQPGMFLYNLAALNHPYAERALEAMVKVASPSGEYTEKHVTDPNGYDSLFWGHRIRPWEGGINMDAAFYYLSGLKPDLGNNRIALCPRMPAGWKEMSITGQRLADGVLDLRVTDDGGTRTYAVRWTGSKPLRADFTVSLPLCEIGSVTVNGAPQRVQTYERWGLSGGAFPIGLAPGQTTTVSVAYEPAGGEWPQIERKRYEYIIPTDIPAYDLVYWENEPRKASSQDVRTFDLLKGKVSFRLISAFSPASPAWLRPFLIRADGSLNAPVFLMGTNSITNSLKYQKWWGSPELVALFTDYMKKGGIIAAMSTGETTSDWFGELLGESSYFVVPLDATPIVAADDDAGKALGLLGLDAEGIKARGAYIYKDMIVLARPASEKAAGTVIVRKVGEGFFMTVLADLSYEQMAACAQKLADRETRAELRKVVDARKPESVPGAFEDFAKDNAYSDDFSSYAEGSTGLPVWLPLTGKWRIEKGEYHQLVPNGYDFISTANARIKGDYEIEAKMRVIEGIQEGGFVFNMPSRFSKGSSQMVRFCGHEALWCGPFNAGGGFSLEHSIGTGLTERDDAWHTLEVVVRNSAGTYDLFVDGKEVAKELKLTNVAKSGGYVGLVACRGQVAFDDLKVKPLGD